MRRKPKNLHFLKIITLQKFKIDTRHPERSEGSHDKEVDASFSMTERSVPLYPHMHLAGNVFIKCGAKYCFLCCRIGKIKPVRGRKRT